jgi:hypothetical protein
MLLPLDYAFDRKEKLINLSRERFAMKRGKIDAKIKRWMKTAISVRN